MAKKRSKMRDRVKGKAEKNKSGGGLYQLPENTEQFKPKKKTYDLDFLPYEVTVNNHPEVEKGELWWERTVWVHFNIGPDGKARVCPRTVGKSCPICEERKELMNADDDSSEELAKKLKPKMRVLYNVIDLNEPDKGVQFFEMAYHNFGSVLDEEIREGDEELADFPELTGGKTIKVRFTEGKMMGNSFVYASRIDFEDREDYDESILEDVIDLDNCFAVPSYEELSKELHGVGGEEKEEDEEEEEEKEEEEEEKPKKSKMGKKKKSSDDEDEKPKKSGRKSKKKKAECPFGHTLGEDCDQTDDCDECDEDSYEKCLDEYDKLENEE